MYRRRRSHREKIFFSFDSFLDVVANVIGIIIRLILVAWVGARTYTSTMEFPEEKAEPAPPAALAALPPPKVTDDPLASKLDLAKEALAAARADLVEKLRNLESAKVKTELTRAELEALARKNQQIADEQQALATKLEAEGKKVQLAALSLDGLRKRGHDIADEIKNLEKLPAHTKEFRFHAPVSRVVQGDEMFLECRAGKVTFIDMPTFMHEVKENVEEVVEQLRKEPKVQRLTSPVGAFRLQYVFEREQGLLESGRNFRYAMTGWVVEPVFAQRGESLTTALAAGSEFRRLADTIDPNQTVVTFWVYPDSFEIFRALRDYLFERDIEVAGRPLPTEAPIAASRNGSRSRGQ